MSRALARRARVASYHPDTRATRRPRARELRAVRATARGLASRCRGVRLPLLVIAVCGFSVGFGSAASANTLLPASVSLPIQVPSLGNWADGTATLAVTYTDTQATGTVTTTPIAFAKGYVFHVDTCIKAHMVSPKHSYDTQCSEKTLDTTASLGTVSITAPTVTDALARPQTGGNAYFSYEVSVSQKQSDGSFKETASSWPSSGLRGASISLPPIDSTTATAPVSEGVMTSTNKTGGLDTGQPDSFCSPTGANQPSAPDAGVSTTSLGTGAPAYYEVGEPTGAYAGQPPKGVMLVIHGGGWEMVGPGYVGYERGDANRWRDRGWRTVNIDYRPCNQSWTDVQWFYDQARQVWGSGMPYCALGESAGGHLALMLAAGRPSLSCVVDEAGPSDGTTLRNESTPAGGTDGPRWAYNLLAAAVGPDFVPWWSPARFASGIHARVLFAVSANDPIVPYAQGTELKQNMLASNPSAYVDTLQLAGGTTPWVHANISADALTTFTQHEDQLVAPLVG
jgi:acetyl esterase/lipase